MADHARDRPTTASDRGPSWRKWVLGVVAFFLFLFMVLNWHRAKVNFIFFSVQLPLVFALLLAAALGALVGWAAPRLRRTSS